MKIIGILIITVFVGIVFVGSLVSMWHYFRQGFLENGDKCKVCYGGRIRNFVFLRYNETDGIVQLKDESGCLFEMNVRDFEKGLIK